MRHSGTTALLLWFKKPNTDNTTNVYVDHPLVRLECVLLKQTLNGAGDPGKIDGTLFANTINN